DIISPDMPFIVDSTLAALRAMGGVVRLFAHPVIRPEGGAAVSVLHIHSDPVTETDALIDEIEATLTDVNRAVADWQPMLEQVRRATAALNQVRSPQRDEAIRFLEWLTEHNFTLLGTRQYRLEGAALVPMAETGLGILSDPD